MRLRGPSFVALQASSMLGEAIIADMIATVGSLDTVMGDVDR